MDYCGNVGVVVSELIQYSLANGKQFIDKIIRELLHSFWLSGMSKLFSRSCAISRLLCANVYVSQSYQRIESCSLMCTGGSLLIHIYVLILAPKLFYITLH